MYWFHRHGQSRAALAARSTLAAAALLTAAVLVGCGYIGGTSEDALAADSTATDSSAAAVADSVRADSIAAARAADAVPVETSAATRGDIASFLVFSSTVETEAAVEIHPEISGQVEAVLAEEGDHVAAGDLLVRLDDEQARLEDRESAVNLRHLEASFERTQEMNRRKLISAQAYEDAVYQLEQARLRRERAALALTQTEIRAPFSGVITSRQVQVGARVAPGGKLFDLVKLDDMIARVHVPGRYLSVVRTGQSAEVESDFLEGMVFTGTVRRISPVVDPKSGTFKVTVGLHDRWEHLRPGIFVTVRIVTDTHADAILVPKEAVVYDGADRFVFVVADSTARRVQLDAGYENATYVEARQGIDAGTPVIVVGQNGLKDQARVHVVRTVDAAGQG